VESLHGVWRDMSCSCFNTQCNYSDTFLPLEALGIEVVVLNEKVSGRILTNSRLGSAALALD